MFDGCSHASYFGDGIGYLFGYKRFGDLNDVEREIQYNAYLVVTKFKLFRGCSKENLVILLGFNYLAFYLSLLLLFSKKELLPLVMKF